MRLRPLRLLGLAVGGWAVWRLLGPETAPRYRGPQRRPLHLPGRTVFVGEREFFVREAGPVTASPVVLVHGWSLDGEMTFHRLIPLLADHHRLIVPDLRNHGRSDWIRERFDVAAMADDLAGMLDAMDVLGATIVGYSLGGFVAQSLVERHPRLVSRLVLAATAARPIDRARGVVWLALRAGRTIARVSRKELSLATATVLRRSGGMDDGSVRWMWEGLMRRDPALYYEAGFAAWRYDGRPAARRITVPTMVIIPTRDQVVAPRTQRELAALLPDAMVIELDGARHESIIERPEAYAKAIRRFVESGG